MPPTAPKRGEVIGSYRLVAGLGRGGMASVYLAEHTRLSRRAAIKVLSMQTALDEVAVSRFLTEARLISEIDHPGVVQILDVVEQQDPLRYAYVMEHVDGPTLRRELDRRPLEPVEVARLGLQLVEALRAIHAHQVVHRDLKPSNILLTGPIDGAAFPLAKLADFGIAKAQDRPVPHKTATGLIIGTPTYMAPEQVSGEPVTPATDIYALGEVLYEMFTGKRVFPEDQRTSLRMKLDPEPPPLDPLPFAASGPIWELIRGCLDPRADRRPDHDIIVEVLQTIDAAPVPVAFEAERPTALEHTSTFAGPLLDPALAPRAQDPLLLDVRPADPVTSPGPMPSVEVPRPRRRDAWALPAGLFALLASLAFVAWSVMPRGDRAAPRAPEVSNAAPTPAPPPAPKVEAPVPTPPAPTSSALRAYAHEPAPPQVRLRFTLSSLPPGAIVQDHTSGAPLGSTPIELEIIDGASRTVRVSKPGYRTEQVEVDGQADVLVRLEQAAPPKRTRPRKRRDKPAPRAEPTPAPKKAPASEDLMPW